MSHGLKEIEMKTAYIGLDGDSYIVSYPGNESYFDTPIAAVNFAQKLVSTGTVDSIVGDFT